MAERKIVLVTGVSGFWGSQLAARLLREDGYQVIGLDMTPPDDKIDGLDFVQADIRSPGHQAQREKSHGQGDRTPRPSIRPP